MRALSTLQKDGRVLKRSYQAAEEVLRSSSSSLVSSFLDPSVTKGSLPNGSAARPLRQAAILHMQRTQGNRAVARYLQRTSPEQRPPEGPLVQRCGGTVHAGCSCGCGGKEQEEMAAEGAPAVQRHFETIQLLSEAEKQQDLQSPKYAANGRLQRAFDNSPALSIGEQGEAVGLVQEGLVADGFILPRSTKPSGEMDGAFGEETFIAVKEFQAKHGLAVDGLVGRETLGKLDELAGSTPGGELPECQIEEGEAAGTEASFLDGRSQGNQSAERAFDLGQGKACKLKKPIGIRPKPGHGPNDFNDYECESKHSIQVHAYYTNADSFGANANGAIKVLKDHNMDANLAGSSLYDPDAPTTSTFSGTVNSMLHLCRVIKASVEQNSPASGFLPAFFVKMGPNVKSAAGMETIAGVHLADLDSQCSILKAKTGLGQGILIDASSSCDIILIHEIVHAAGFSGHDTGSGTDKNVMASSGCSVKDQDRLTHHQVRKLCNASF